MTRNLPEIYAIGLVDGRATVKVAENKDYIAEGLVLKAPCGLLNRRGKRIITKIKYCDYKDL